MRWSRMIHGDLVRRGELLTLASVALLAVGALVRPFVDPAQYFLFAASTIIVSALLAAATGIVGGWRASGNRTSGYRHHWPSILLGISCICYALAAILDATLNFTNPDRVPFPSVADIGYLGAYISCFAGLIGMPRARLSVPARMRLTLDALMIILAVVTFSWYFILGPIIQTTSGDTLAKWISFAYPFGDLLFICFVVILLSPLNNVSRGAIGLLALSLIIMVITNTVFAFQTGTDSYIFGGFLDVAWAFGHALFPFAMRIARRDTVAYPDNEQIARTPVMGWTLLPYCFVPAVVALVVYTLTHPSDPAIANGVFATARILVVVIMLRQILAIVEIERLQRIAATNSERLGRLNTELRKTRDELVAKNSALSAANDRWETLATTDPLTGLPNHRALTAAIDAEIARALRHETPCAILFFDLDHFKALNDGYGHAVGDTVLRELAQVARVALRTEDHLGRWGGEEFIALLPACDHDGAQIVAERLREAVARHTYAAGGGLHLTCSIGLVCAPEDGVERDQLLAQADQAMYVAKERGRNRVCAVRTLRYRARNDATGDSSRATTSLDGLVDSLGMLLAARDNQVRGRDEATAELIARIATELGMDSSEAKMIALAGRLRDVGAMAIPEAILHKPDRLDVAEWERVRAHPTFGADTLARIPALRGIAPLVRSHHERWDGQGYPAGLAGEAIPLGARIIAVADAFVAMTTPRPYRPARERDEALQEIETCSGSQFDPLVVALLRSLIEDDRRRSMPTTTLRPDRTPSAPIPAPHLSS